MAVALYLIYLLIPIVLLLVGSFGARWTNTLLPEGFTTAWYVQVATDPSFRRAFTTSLTVAAGVAVTVLVTATPLAWALATGGGTASRLALRLVALLPIAVPELVLAFGFVVVFSSDALPFLGSTWLLVLGVSVVTLPYMVQTLAADIRHLGLAALEQAAESLGASSWRRFIDIVLPSLRHSLLAGLMTVTALTIGEFQLANLVSGFLSRPFPVVLLQAFYGAAGFACAATVILLVLAVLASTGAALAARGTARA